MSDDTTTPLPEEDDKLRWLYQETIEHHKAYLDRLQAAFDKHCDNIGTKAKAEIDQIPDEEQEARQEVMQKEQEELDKALAELKYAISKSNSNAMKKLEEIQNQLEGVMDLNKELDSV